MRVVHYNICRGAEGRLDVVVEVVRALNPDILFVNEAVGWDADNEAVIRAFAGKAGLSGGFLARANTKYNLAIFSKKTPLSIRVEREGFWHAAVFSEFSFPKSGKFNLVSVHLCPKDEDARLAELDAIFRLVDKRAPTLFIGDFNSLSHRDPYDRELLLKKLEEAGVKKFGYPKLRFDVAERMEREGFSDGAVILKKAFSPTVPTSFSIENIHIAPLRIDYAFVSEPLKPFLKDVFVFSGGAASSASDHYPLVVDFDF